jgi:anti-sigma B factor antagonist
VTATWTDSSSPDLMSVRTERSDAAGRVTVAGEIDCSTAPGLTACIDSLLAAEPREVVVDLTEVTFLDSAGLHALVSAHARATAAGARLRVLVATRAVLRPIEVTGLWDVLGAEMVDPGGGVA